MRFHLQTPDPVAFAATRDALLAALREALPDAEVLEVGSTAVPGVIGKGDLDVLVRVEADRFEDTRARLDARYPRNPDQLSTPIYQGYTVPSDFDVAIQLTVAGGPFDDFTRFLDALRADPALCARYNALKRAWDGQPMDAYRQAKSVFIQGVLDALPADRTAS